MSIVTLLEKIVNIQEVATDEVDLQMIEEIENDNTDESINWEEYKARREKARIN